MRWTRLVALALGAGGVVGVADACMTPTPPVDPPPRTFWRLHSPTDLWVWVELRNVFETQTAHDCSCALGVQGGLPGGVTLADVVTLGVYNTVTEMIVRDLNAFDTLAPSAPSTAGWAAGPDAPDPLTGSPQADTWFGFGGSIPPVTPGLLGPDDIWVICFQFEVPQGFAVTGTAPAQIGGGLGNPDFSPMFGEREDADSHLPAYSAVFGLPVPAPGSIVLLAFASACVIPRRRR